MDTFDLEDYIKVIHFDDIKVPTLPFHLPSTKIYYGISTEQDYQEHPMHLSVSGFFHDSPILYHYEEVTAHLEETLQYAKDHENYLFIRKDISAFRNIQIEIVKNKYVIVSKIKSPSIHFVIRHPSLVQALQNFMIPVIE